MWQGRYIFVEKSVALGWSAPRQSLARSCASRQDRLTLRLAMSSNFDLEANLHDL
jgi:hypothetical protein